MESETQWSATSRRLSTPGPSSRVSSPGPSSRVTTPNPPIRLTPAIKKRKRDDDDDVAEVKYTLRSISKSLASTQEALPRAKGQIFAEYLASKIVKIENEDLRDETEVIAIVYRALRQCRNK